MVTCWEVFIERLRNDGGKILVVLTILQTIFFFGYSIFYTVVYNKVNPTDQLKIDPA
jgi:hypothetical protein